MKNKLYQIPPIYYLNLDHRNDRREYMEFQFDYWKIKNYHRISASKYLAKDKNKWKKLILDEKIEFGEVCIVNAISHLEMIKDWLSKTDDQYMIMMEDDYDLSLIEYWNFDWNYLMNTIPKNWDCIQLGFENKNVIPFFLHPVRRGHGFGPCLINRFYAEKLIRLHCFDDKFLLNIKTNDVVYSKYYGTVDNFITGSGKTYSIPLITNNPDLGSDLDPNGLARKWFYECKELYYNWWKNEHHNFSLDDFFNYGKPNDFLMMRLLNCNNKREKQQNVFNYK